MKKEQKKKMSYYIINHVENSFPGKRMWSKNDKYNSGYDYSLSTKSTFPDYIKFAYVKRPKYWFILSEEEKLLEDRYFQYNTKDIIRILNKYINDKSLTDIQNEFFNTLIDNFKDYEHEYFEEFKEYPLSDEIIDMTNCPF